MSTLPRFAACLVAVALVGCSGETYLTGPGVVVVEAEDEFPEFNGATLEVYAPASAEVLSVDEDVYLDAEIISADGEPMDFDEIVWETDQEDEPIAVGRVADVELDWGIHTFTVTADLPNGDRLQTILGGVRIQGPHTGIYSGNFEILIDAEFQGTPITAACLGGLDFVIDMSGETLVGENGSCTINLFVLGEFDVNYNVEGEVDDDDAEGDVQVDLGFFDIPVGWEGGFDDDHTLFAEFEGSAILIDFTGSIDAHRVSLYVDP